VIGQGLDRSIEQLSFILPSSESNSKREKEMTPLFSFIGTLGTGEMIVLLIIGVLLFGRKLPEVGRYLGKGIVEFKKGIRGLEDDVEGSHAPGPRQEASLPAEPPRPPQRIGTTAPKFEDAPKNVASTPPQI